MNSSTAVTLNACHPTDSGRLQCYLATLFNIVILLKGQALQHTWLGIPFSGSVVLGDGVVLRGPFKPDALLNRLSQLWLDFIDIRGRTMYYLDLR